MDNFANMPQREKQLYFEYAANKKGLSQSIIEKDFWVCWTLQQLFSISELSNKLLFKGGTSLSKGYNLIERFSEDIDISIDKSHFGYTGLQSPEEALSIKRRESLIRQLSTSCSQFVQSELRRKLIELFSEKLNRINIDWRIIPDPQDNDMQSLLFYYPVTTQTSLNPYIQPAIKIELGARGAKEPNQTIKIMSFVAEITPNVMDNPSVGIQTLAAERTFWEKATIAHMYAHWPNGKALPERQSRHFYDLYKLLRSEVKKNAMANTKLLENVSTHKSIYFRARWANYENAKQGTLRLIPDDDILTALKKDYVKMQDMFYGKPITWSTILEEIFKFETEFNNPS